MRTAVVTLVAGIAVVLVTAAPPTGTSAACPANLANRIKGARAASQLITVEAARYKTTAATFRLWERWRTCWVAVDGPWTARVGRN
ncbi:MAG: hypothetical protein ACRDNP_15225, partial [Gaiellaceae bacterium]